MTPRNKILTRQKLCAFVWPEVFWLLGVVARKTTKNNQEYLFFVAKKTGLCHCAGNSPQGQGVCFYDIASGGSHHSKRQRFWFFCPFPAYQLPEPVDFFNGVNMQNLSTCLKHAPHRFQRRGAFARLAQGGDV